jgi:putative heme-binding domain-containing protein
MHKFAIWAALSGFLLPAGQLGAQIRLAQGLSIHRLADDDLVPDCTAIAVGRNGQVIASGPGYLRRLLDLDHDGRCDRFQTLVNVPGRAAQGICVDGNHLYYVANGGVWQTIDDDQDGLPDAAPKRVLEIQTGGEHDAHALRKGPDGFWYLIVGNGPQKMFALQNVDQPIITHPRAGAIWRISPDWSRREVWAHGFRNAYDFDFAPDQAIDTFDSDGERDVSLPWYRPTRVFRVQRGDDAGWVTRSWKRPDGDPQMPRVLASWGRGSPTGVLRYRHRRLPSRFHAGVFVLDWTFGRVLFVADQGRTECVARPTGTTGFAVTDIDCLPDGRLIVSVGGRGSRGGIYVIDAAQPAMRQPSADRPQPPRPILWHNEVAPQPTDPTERSIARLRGQPLATPDHEAADQALTVLEQSDASNDQKIAAMTLMIESLGGLGAGNPRDARGKEQVAAVFDGYRSRLRPKLSAQVAKRASDQLIAIIQAASVQPNHPKQDQPPKQPEHPGQGDHDRFVHEAIRTLAVLEPDDPAALTVILDAMDRVDDPVDKLHRLIAAARIPTPRSDDVTERIAAAMREIPRQVHDRSLSTERNWTARLGELFLALARRDSLLPSRLVSDPSFGHVAHLVWTEPMDPENLERARIKCLAQNRDRKIDPLVARFIALGNDAVPRPQLRQWLSDPATRPAAQLAIARHPRESDIDQLQQAARSTDKVLREAASGALQRLGVEVADRQPASDSIKQWLARSESITSLDGDPAVGKGLFAARQCAVCHGGSKSLGPSLQGASKRFNRVDLFRATVDPSHNISDRYRPQQVLTSDGQIITGMIVYSSNEGLTLLTADAKTQRINADSIAESKAATQSLMPAGLVDGLSDQQVADLLAYMGSL